MIEFNRKEYVNELRLFRFMIDQKYIDQTISEIKKIYGTKVELTEKDFIDSIDGADNEVLDIKLTKSYTSFDGNEVTYETSVRDIINEWINDDTWDQDYEVIDCDTEDVYDDYTVR